MKWRLLCFSFIFLASCRNPNIMRIAINDQNDQQEHYTNKTTANTATPHIIGNFTIEPAIIHTLPATTPQIKPSLLTSTPSPDGEVPLIQLGIEALASRSYGQSAGNLTLESTLENTGGFARALISYPSDGLKIYGFINIPPGTGPFPVVIFLHGYVDDAVYETLDYSVRYADDLARQGYIVIHPNLRGYPPSDDGPDYFETGKAVDTLNLVALVQQDAGKSGLLLQADPSKIALWGHSTGGSIALRVITVNMPSMTDPGPAVKAAILYASMSGDEAKNAYQTFYKHSGTTRWQYEITVPSEDLQAISPHFYYERIEAAVQVHHGAQDTLIPVEWSRETCAQMEEAGVSVECYEYRTQAHNFCCDSYRWMLDRIVTFLDMHFP